jgi:crossover junction endodeoxyribonuclease RuvC
MSKKKIANKAPESIIGIDPATIDTGWAIITQELQLTSQGKIHYPESQPVYIRLKGLYDSLSLILDENPQVQAIVIEDQFHARNTNTLKALSWARGIIMLLAAQRGLPIYVVNNKTAKKNAKKGNATKEEIRVAIIEKFNLGDDLDNNISDAIAIGLAYYCQGR